MSSGEDAGIHNFRDLGGLPTADARRVKRGLIFRSAALDGLNPLQRGRIVRLGVKMVVDFRSGLERGVVDALYAADGVRVWHPPDGSTNGAPQHSLEALLARPSEGKAVVQTLYRDIPFVQATAYRALYDAIAGGTLPLVFHCAAGKDRTGVAAALLLDMLGVPREAILADYALSGASFDYTRESFLSNFPDRDSILAQEAQWLPLLHTDSSYLEAMFEEIEARHGSVRGYMAQALGMPGRSIDRIETLLLE